MSSVDTEALGPPLLWEPSTKAWNGPRLHAAIVARRVTVREFAGLAHVSPAVVYKAIAGGRTTDSVTVRIFAALEKRQPMMLVFGEET